MYVVRLFPPTVSRVTDSHTRLGFVCVFLMKTMGPSPALGQLRTQVSCCHQRGWVRGFPASTPCTAVTSQLQPSGPEEPTRLDAFQRSVSAEWKCSHQDETPDDVLGWRWFPRKNLVIKVSVSTGEQG